ncbi:MAG: hypothetical protein SWQ30_15560 [Thermodesulfobacteriota bacterium]|nr:hypothetical protein [Thermodesulfobacteriota bacterium]
MVRFLLIFGLNTSDHLEVTDETMVWKEEKIPNLKIFIVILITSGVIALIGPSGLPMAGNASHFDSVKGPNAQFKAPPFSRLSGAMSRNERSLSYAAVTNDAGQHRNRTALGAISMTGHPFKHAGATDERGKREHNGSE